ncbi:MAG: helix-hairpin-helix domain-containing protein [Solirubrobacterales bacterium]
MARRRFRIFGKGAGDVHGGPGEPEPAGEPGAPPAAPGVDSDARDWTVGEDPEGPAAAASALEEGAEELLPPELHANGTSASPGPAPDAAEWLLRGHEARQPARVASEAGAPPAAERPIQKAQAVEEDVETSRPPLAEEDVEKATRPATERLAAVEQRLAEAARRADRAEGRAAMAEKRLIAAGRAADERLERVAEAQRELEEATERAKRRDEVEPTSIAAMAAEAESLASDSEAATAAEPELEPPSWVAVEPKPVARSRREAETEAEAEPEPEAKSEPEPEPEAEAEPDPESPRRSAPAVEPDHAPAEGMVSLSLAEFKELRELGMSVTQAKRVIRYREERNGFRTLDELDQVPGFPRTFLSGVKERLVP